MKSLIKVKTDYGSVILQINKLMNEKNISVSKMVKLSGLHHQVVLRYYHNEAGRYDADVLAKFCYVLECSLDEIIVYQPPS